MTVTILPGQDMQADPGTPSPKPPAPKARKGVVVAAAAAVALAALGGGAFVLTRSDDAPAVASPTEPPAHHAPAAVKLPAHGRVPVADLRAVATPAFAAMASSLGGLTTSGHVHRVRNDSAGPGDRRFNQCIGSTGHRQGQRGFESGKYESGNHTVQGQLDLMASAAVASRDLATITSPTAVACAQAVLPQMVRHQKLGKYVSATDVSLHRIRAVPRAFHMRVVVGYVVNGHEVPVQVDFLGAAVGRAELTMVVTSHDTKLAYSRRVAALRAMAKQVRSSLR